MSNVIESLRGFRKLVTPSQLNFPSGPIDGTSLPLKIGSNMSIKKYNKFQYKAPRGYKYRHEDDGDVFIIETFDEEHSRLIPFLAHYFNAHNTNAQALNRPIVVQGDTLHPSPVAGIEEERREIAPNIAIVPNVPYVPRPIIRNPGPSPPRNSNGSSHARIIVELGIWQSTNEWIAKCQLWLQENYVRYVFGIKLHRPNNAKDGQGRFYRAMTARLWTQGAGHQTWDFGTIPKTGNIVQDQPVPAPGCTGPGLKAFVVNIPVDAVFYDPPVLPPPAEYAPTLPSVIPADSDFTIDLYDVQQEVLNSQRN